MPGLRARCGDSCELLQEVRRKPSGANCAFRSDEGTGRPAFDIGYNHGDATANPDRCR